MSYVSDQKSGKMMELADSLGFSDFIVDLVNRLIHSNSGKQSVGPLSA